MRHHRDPLEYHCEARSARGRVPGRIERLFSIIGVSLASFQSPRFRYASGEIVALSPPFYLPTRIYARIHARPSSLPSLIFTLHTR